MALKLPAAEAANVAIQSIGCGYDISLDLRLNDRKRRYLSDVGNNPYRNCRLIEIEEDEGRDIVLPGGLLLLNVPGSIKCDEGEHTRLHSDVLSFRLMSEQFNQELSLSGKIPSGHFNSMFEFSGNWPEDASTAKTLAFDGVFISLYTIALEESHMVLCDHVKKAVPSKWEPALLARFIEKFGTHIIVGVKMGGKDVLYMKQHYASSLEPSDVQQRLKEMTHKRFLNSEHTSQNDKYDIRQQQLRFPNSDTSSSYSYEEHLLSIFKRRGGSDDRNLKHNEWLHTVQSEPDVITMSFIPITSLLNGVLGSGYLSHAINLYLCYKPPFEELCKFLDFQLPRQWAPLFSELSLSDPQHEQQSTTSLQFSFFGPKLYLNTNKVDVGMMPVTGLRLYLNRERNNQLEIHLQHLSGIPKFFQLEDSVNGISNSDSDDRRYYEKVQGKNYDYVCTAPVESGNRIFLIVNGAHLHVRDHGSKKVLFLRLRFSELLGCTARRSE
ncbi:unnamed protein product [Lactuca virosa]|uniref:MACPF domain-containing protein n=1 Tax=Lactuca virosa TaxID=75947 RepID=A0AAU9P4M4_9ASTR|nr:unnamed protein product [Lactuca virosa]